MSIWEAENLQGKLRLQMPATEEKLFADSPRRMRAAKKESTAYLPDPFPGTFLQHLFWLQKETQHFKYSKAT